jgi:hypothetical protein
MTKDELERIVFGELTELEVANSFSNLTEEQRRKLAPHVVSLKQQIINGKPKKGASQLVIGEIKSINEFGFWNRGGIGKVQLAIHAVCSISVIKARGQGYIGRLSKELSIILNDRKPKWLDEWLKFEFSHERPRIPISTIYQWMEKGLCIKPNADGYTEEFVKFFAEEHRESNKEKYLTLSQRLKQNIEHLEDVWKMFKVEHDGFNANYFHTSQRDYDTPDVIEEWPEVILAFSEEGLLERQKLLNEILNGLHNDIKQNQLSGMHKLFDRFKPTLEELSTQHDKLTSLFSSKVGHIVKFSLKHLSKLQKVNKLDIKSFLAEAPAVFTQAAKGNSILVLKLIAALIKKEKDKDKSPFISVLIHALQHPNVDVQKLTLCLLIDIKESLTDDNKQELENLSEYINPSLRSMLFELIEKQNQDSAEKPVLEVNLQEITQLLNNTHQQTLTDLGLNEIDLSKNDIGKIRPIKPNVPLFSIKEHCQMIEPINDVDTLIQVISSAIEELTDHNNFERILDGLSRLCDQKNVDFDDKVAPLLHRLSKEFEKHESLVAFRGDIRLAFKSLLLSWLNGSHEELRKKHYYVEYETLISRLENLQKRILKKQAYPLLSAPTHENGWIEPQIWLNRLYDFQHYCLELDRHDFCQSLMRLMPLNRQDKDHALLKAQTITGNLGRVARFALGAELEINRKDKKDYDLWITAARCISPHKDWSDEFKEFKLKNDFPGGLKPTQLEFSITADEEYNYAHFEQNIRFGLNKQLFEFDDSVLNKLNLLHHFKHSLSWNQLPTIAIHRHDAHASFWSYHIGNTWLSQWMCSLWPNNLDPLTALAIKSSKGNLDTKSSNMYPTYGCFQGLFQTPYSLSPLSHLLLFMGLNAVDQDAKYACIDAYIEAVDLGKLNEIYAANALVQLIEGKDTKFNRIADAFKQITPISSLHAYSVSQILQQVLCTVDLKLRNLFHIIELLLEIHIELQIPLTQECYSKLTTITGSSKMAKAAKRLISLNIESSESMNRLKLNIIKMRLTKNVI